MKKTSLFVVALAFVSNLLEAQTIPKGSITVSAGYGAVVPFAALINLGEEAVKDAVSEAGNFSTTRTGPIYFRAEYAVSNNFTAGIGVNFSQYNTSFDIAENTITNKYAGTLKLNSPSIMLRGMYHFPFANDRATFGIGGGIGYRRFSFDYQDNAPATPNTPALGFGIPFTVEANLGVRYFVTQNVGLYAEAGLTRSLLQGGIVFKFGGENAKP